VSPASEIGSDDNDKADEEVGLEVKQNCHVMRKVTGFYQLGRTAQKLLQSTKA
jgi:hypothetical protein